MTKRMTINELIEEVLKYEKVDVEELISSLGLTNSQFTIMKSKIKIKRPEVFNEFISKLTGDEMLSSEYSPRVCMARTAIDNNLNVEQILDRFNMTLCEYTSLRSNLYRLDPEIFEEFNSHMIKFKTYNERFDLIMNTNAVDINDLCKKINLSKSQVNSCLIYLRDKKDSRTSELEKRLKQLKKGKFITLYEFMTEKNCGYYEITHEFNITDSEVNVLLNFNKDKYPKHVKRMKQILKSNAGLDKSLYTNIHHTFKEKEKLNEFYDCIFVKNMNYKEISSHFDMKYTGIERFVNVTIKRKDPDMYNKIKEHYAPFKRTA